MPVYEVVYVVLAHHDHDTLNLLLSNLRGRKVLVCVPRGSRLDVERITTYPNQIVAQSQNRAYWGGFSLVRLAIEAMNMAVTLFEASDLQLALLSGQCTPVRPLSEFESWVRASPQRVIANAVPLKRDANAWSMSTKRMARQYFFDAGAGYLLFKSKGLVHRAIKRLALHCYIPIPWRRYSNVFAGSQWLSLPGRVAADLGQALERGELKPFRFIFAPDEVAVQTYVRNGAWSGAVRQIENQESPVSIAHVANYHYLRASMSGYLKPEELEEASRRGFFFARKICVVEDPQIVDVVRSLVAARSV